AGELNPAQTLAEGYRRNNAGNYAEAAEFFDTLQNRLDAEDAARDTAVGRDQRMLAEAAEVLARPVTPIAEIVTSAGVEITPALSTEINSSLPAARRLGGT